MKYHFEFTEDEKFYSLLLNGETVNLYSKIRDSKQAAENRAYEVVQMYVRRFGPAKVKYDGLMITN